MMANSLSSRHLMGTAGAVFVPLGDDTLACICTHAPHSSVGGSFRLLANLDELSAAHSDVEHLLLLD